MEKILNADVSGLKKMLKNNEVSSKDLVMIFTHRCLTVGLKLNCLTEFNFDEAIAVAEKLDA